MKVTVCKGCGQKMMAVDSKGNPSCITCFGLSPGNSIPMEMEIPNTVKCIYCKHEVPTSQDLPFLDAKHGTYYCGCRGWD